ncbi:hypothetical protein ACE6H2_001945 [Prunus campanulata]
MGSKCHSLTPGKPYAWEQKLYEEVKRKPRDYMIENAPNIQETKDMAERLKTKLELK